MTLDGYRGRKTTMQQQQQYIFRSKSAIFISATLFTWSQPYKQDLSPNRTARLKVPCLSHKKNLTLKAPITTAEDDIHKYFSLFFRENKT